MVAFYVVRFFFYLTDRVYLEKYLAFPLFSLQGKQHATNPQRPSQTGGER